MSGWRLAGRPPAAPDSSTHRSTMTTTAPELEVSMWFSALGRVDDLALGAAVAQLIDEPLEKNH